MGETLPVTEARAQFGRLIRRVCHGQERVTITARLRLCGLVPQELAMLGDALALAQYRARQVGGEVVGVPRSGVRARIGPGR
ncbi:type II toxin-antitoxin system prevent-host-death family antitoxin [Streptomyces mesophilus]|uniref:type II toxin-antitoxin system prevent-host-death family antitoxin n=1 Tax=Streptomyces mesophilus TaxID=1775132 RepID=UPI00332BC1D2